MKHIKMIMVLAATLAAQSTLADGFRCINEDGDLKATVYNQVEPELGTRSAAVMVLSNPTIGAGRRTIARFSAEAGTLESERLVYSADVDLRFSDSSRKGELVGGTKLGELDTVLLVVNHNYLYPVSSGALVDAFIVLKKRSGDVITHEATCERYLKN